MNIREYNSNDRQQLEKCIRDLQEFVAVLDPYEWTRKGENFDVQAYVNTTLSEVEQYNGKIFLAVENGIIIGCVIGKIVCFEGLSALENFVTKDGKVAEIFVNPEYRGKRVGVELLRAMEEYFRSKHCDSVTLECFGPNKTSYDFYKSQGYEDRVYVLLKKL